MKTTRRTAVLAAALLTALAPALPASAAPTSIELTAEPAERMTIVDAVEAHHLTPEQVDVLERQAVIDQYAATLQQSAEFDTTDGDGLGGLVVNAEHNQLLVYWHGEMTAAAEGHLDRATSEGIDIVVESSPYTRTELLAEVRRMGDLPLFAGEANGHRSMAAAPAYDGTGIDITLGGVDGLSATAVDAIPALQSDYPLEITHSDGIEPAYRWYDWAPYYGGAYITRPGINACTSGFGVTGNNGAATYMLTAAHCGEGEWRTGQVTLPDGTVHQNVLGSTIPGRDLDHDGQAILTQNGSSNSVYVGDSIDPPNGDLGSNTGVQVSGTANSFNGDLVCNGGSYSGTICGIRVASTGVTVVIDPPVNGIGTLTDMVNAQNVGTAAAGHGDSGGPVYDVYPTDGTIHARGIVSAIALGSTWEEPCQGYAPAGRICSSSMYYGEINDIMDTIGVHIND